MKTILFAILFNTTYIFSQTLVGYWSFSGNTADSSGMGNHGTIVSGSGTVTATTDRFNNPNSAYLFNNGRINLGSAGFPTGNMQRTLCAWFKRNSTTTVTYQNIFGFGANTTNGCRSYLHIDINQNYLGNENRNSINNIMWTPDTNWHFLCAVFPQGATMSGEFLIYFDGVLTADSSILPNTLLNSDLLSPAIGCLGSFGGQFFFGKIDDVRLYSTALTSGQILELYNSQPAVPSLIAPLNNSSGISLTPLLDWSQTAFTSGYRVLLSADSTFASTLIDTSVTGDSLRVPPGRLNNNVKYFWKVRSTNLGGISPYTAHFSFTTSLVAIEPTVGFIPNSFKLYNNYPNPFNPVTKISFDLPKQSFTKLIVFDMLGKRIAELVSEDLNAGRYEVKFDAGNLASGIYFYKLNTEEFTAVKKMILIK